MAIDKRGVLQGITQQGQPTPGGRGFNIAQFEAFRSTVGILRNHDYILEIPFPEGLPRQSPNGEDRTGTYRTLELTCESINFPATGAQTYKVQRYSYGALETRPTIPQFADLQAVFVTDQNSDVWRFFTDWLRVAVNFDFAPNPIVNAQMDVYEISYKHEYAVDMFLYIYNPYGTCVRKVGFREAWPTVVGDIALGWGSGNQLIKVPVSFAFFDWSEWEPDDGIQQGPSQSFAPPGPPLK